MDKDQHHLVGDQSPLSMKRTATDVFADSPVSPSKKRRITRSPPLLVPDMWIQIARLGESVYRALLAIPEFARSLTCDLRMDFRVFFGHSVNITSLGTYWLRNNLLHRLDGPAVEYGYLRPFISYYRNGKLSRSDMTLPCVFYSDGHMAYYDENGKCCRVETVDGKVRRWGDGGTHAVL